MAGKLDGSVDGDGEIEVQQNGAVGVAFVAAEGAPGLVAGKGELDGFVLGEGDVSEGLRAAAG